MRQPLASGATRRRGSDLPSNERISCKAAPGPPSPPNAVMDTTFLHCCTARHRITRCCLPKRCAMYLSKFPCRYPAHHPWSSAFATVSSELVGIACASGGASTLTVSWDHLRTVMGRTHGFQDNIGSECPALRMSPSLPKVVLFCFRKEGVRSALQRRIFCVKPPPASPPLPPSLGWTYPVCIAALHAIAQRDVVFQNGAPCIC
jgi:hypothetical protein